MTRYTTELVPDPVPPPAAEALAEDIAVMRLRWADYPQIITILDALDAAKQWLDESLQQIAYHRLRAEAAEAECARLRAAATGDTDQ